MGWESLKVFRTHTGIMQQCVDINDVSFCAILFLMCMISHEKASVFFGHGEQHKFATQRASASCIYNVVVHVNPILHTAGDLAK